MRLVGVAVSRLVCAQHGHVVIGVQVPLWNYQNMKMKKPPSEANSEKGDLSGEGRLGECPKDRESGNPQKCEAIPHGRSTAESKPRADGQEPHRRPTRRDKLSGVRVSGVTC